MSFYKMFCLLCFCIGGKPLAEYKKRGLLLSAASVGVAILMLGYSAFGWMTMSRTLRAQGMNVSVFVPEGLEISTEENGDYADHVEVNLKEIVRDMTLGGAVEFRPETDSFYLLPASSYEGLTIWQTGNSDGTGVAKCAENEFQSGHPVMYNTVNKTFEGHYIDVTLWLRTPKPDGSAVALNKAETAVTSTDSATIKNTVRAAFLNADATGISYGGNEGYDTLVYADPARWTAKVVTESTVPGVSKYIEPPKYMTFGSSVSEQTVCVIPAVAAGETYAKASLTVRIWIEGQDDACIADIGGRSFDLKIGFSAVD